MTAAAKARRVVKAAQVDKHEQRCLITHGPTFLDYAHCLPRSTKESELDQLESAWNMERYTLNVDTRYNILCLAPTLHRAFDMGLWILLPETWIIERYYDAKDDHRMFPDINAKLYQYTLIPHEKMDGVQIGRDILHDYPYRDFPILRSHVHPRFIICNSGSKFNGDLSWLVDPGARGINEENAAAMIKVAAIWQSWMKAVPTAEFLENAPKDGNRDVEDNDTQRTTPHRVPLCRSTNKRKRRAARE
ncbi:hypothetical protein EDB84DRAFT_1098980 [Lactarius hengduanensis]|nr:hypothetical protein EDB84DRAFT_1098980 [Lactarius hengduanensis]